MLKPKPSHPGKAFRHERQQLGWSQETFAAKTGVSVGTVKNAENGEHLKRATHRDLEAALNKWRALENPAKPPVYIPYPGDEAETATSAPGSPDVRCIPSPLDNPHQAALHEALRLTAPSVAVTKIRIGGIRSPAELKNLWLIDNAGYGEANITFPHFLKLWEAFPLGLRVLFFENDIMGALGIWPVSSKWADQFKSARLKEAQLDSQIVRQCASEPARHWYDKSNAGVNFAIVPSGKCAPSTFNSFVIFRSCSFEIKPRSRCFVFSSRYPATAFARGNC